MVVLGVDPGSRALGCAVLGEDRLPRVFDGATYADGVNGAEFFRQVERIGATVAVVERVGAMPGQGVSSTFAFGRAYGTILGVLAAAGVPVVLITPAVWKKHYRLPAKDKEAARQKAIELFPGVEGLALKKHHNRAEALLLAHYYRQTTKTTF